MSDVIQKIITANQRNEGSVVAGVNKFGYADKIIPPMTASGVGYIGVDVSLVESNLTNRFDEHSESGVYATVFAGIVHNHNGVYANAVHNHSGVYSEVGHSHSGVYWDDLRVPANSLHVGPTIAAYTQYYGGLYLPAFATAGTVDEAYFAVQLPHSYKQGTHIYPHVHWSPGASGGYNNMGVAWMLDLSWTNHSGTFPFPTAYSGIDSWTTLNNYEHRKIGVDCSGVNYLDGTGKEISSMIVGKVYRQNDRGDDTFTAAASLLEVDFHYQQDWLGSSTQGVK